MSVARWMGPATTTPWRSRWLREIEAAHGQGSAVANSDSVADWDAAQRIIKTAIDRYGRIDIVVNNAGILRDTIFHRMTPEEFDAVVKVVRRRLLRQPRRDPAYARAGKRVDDPHDLDLRADRQCGAGEPLGGEAALPGCRAASPAIPRVIRCAPIASHRTRSAA